MGVPALNSTFHLPSVNSKWSLAPQVRVKVWAWASRQDTLERGGVTAPCRVTEKRMDLGDMNLDSDSDTAPY